MPKYFFLFLISCLCCTEVFAQHRFGTQRKDITPHTPSVFPKKRREPEPTDGGDYKEWIILANYTPHYFRLRGDSQTTAIDMSSQICHRLGLGIGRVLSQSFDVSLMYYVDYLNFDTVHGRVIVDRDDLFNQDLSAQLRYYWYDFEFEFSVTSKERIQYEYLGPNFYNITNDRNIDFLLGGNYLLTYWRYFLTAGGQIGFYTEGGRALEANGPGGITETYIDLGRRAVEIDFDYYKWGLRLNYRYEWSNVNSESRRLEDLSLMLYYQHSI